MALVNTLNWRYATKKFDPSRIISEEQVTDLLRGMDLAPSSYGLQPYEIIVIHNQELQDKLVEHSYNQQQVADASHVLVIAARKKTDASYIEKYTENIAKLRKQSIEDLSAFRDMMISTVASWEEETQFSWAKNQTYVVLGVLMSLCADMHIDACPMEGFVSEKYNEILDLVDQDLHATLVIPIGYRSEDDQMQHAKKYRKGLDELIQLRY